MMCINMLGLGLECLIITMHPHVTPPAQVMRTYPVENSVGTLVSQVEIVADIRLGSLVLVGGQCDGLW
jgi:hypothetical protein